MNKLLKWGIPILTLTLISCETDPLGDDEGDTRDVFEGQWSVAENSKLLGNRSYTVDIEKSIDFPTRINIFDFYSLGQNDSIYGTVSSILSDAVTIPSQTLDGNLINGSGTLVNDNLIEFTFYVDDGNDIDTVSADYTR